MNQLYLVIALFLNFSPQGEQSQLDQEINPQNFQARLLAYAIFEETNQARDSLGFSLLKNDAVLDTAANYQAYRMQKENDMQHNWRRDRKFGNLQKRIETLGGGFKAMGENIARNFILKVEDGEYYFLDEAEKAIDKDGELIPNKTYRDLAKEAVRDWLNSPGHRANLLGDFDYLGVGVSPLVPLKKGPNFDVYLCQNFGTKWKNYLSFSFVSPL